MSRTFMDGELLTAELINENLVNPDLADTGAVALAPATSWTGWYRVREGLVEYWTSYTASTPTGTTRSVASGIPAEYLPDSNMPLACYCEALSAGMTARLLTNGTVEILNQTGYSKNPLVAHGSWLKP